MLKDNTGRLLCHGTNYAISTCSSKQRTDLFSLPFARANPSATCFVQTWEMRYDECVYHFGGSVLAQNHNAPNMSSLLRICLVLIITHPVPCRIRTRSPIAVPCHDQPALVVHWFVTQGHAAVFRGGWRARCCFPTSETTSKSETIAFHKAALILSQFAV